MNNAFKPLLKTFSSSEIKNLVSSNFSDIKENNDRLNVVSDRSYACLDLDWVENEAYKGYTEWMRIFDFGRGIRNSKWKTNWDCEDISEGFKLYLKLIHAQANKNTATDSLEGKENESDAQSIAAGVIYFKNSARSAHAINLFFDNKEEPRYFEPMYGKFINIGEEERASVWYANF